MFINFGHFFMNYTMQSQFDTLMEKKPDATLEDILDEDNMIQELKSSASTKFAKFITDNPSNYVRMINYIKTSDPMLQDQKKQIKYQFLISELFAAENTTLIDYLFEPNQHNDSKEQQNDESVQNGQNQHVNYENNDGEAQNGHAEELKQQDQPNGTEETVEEETKETQEEKQIKQMVQQLSNEAEQEAEKQEKNEQIRKSLLPTLFSFLDQDSLCVTSAGYFSKTVIPLIRRRGCELFKFLTQNPHHYSNLFKHMDTLHISEVVEKLILLETQNPTGDNYINERKQLLKRSLGLAINKQYQLEVVDNISNMINEIIHRAASNPQNREWQQFVEIINQPRKIFEIGDKSRVSSVFQILTNLLNYCQKIKQYKQEQSEVGQDEEVIYDGGEEQELPNIKGFYEVINLIPQFLLSSNIYSRSFITTYGNQTNPLSYSKLLVIQLLIQLLSTNDPYIIELVSKTNVFKIIRDLIVQHQFNNQLLVLWEKLEFLIFDSALYELLQGKEIESGLISFIIQTNQNKGFLFGTLKNQQKPGCQGVLTKLSNLLIAKQSSSELLQASLETPEWMTYKETVLNKINDVEKQWLCNVNPKYKPNENAWNEDVEQMLDKFRYSKTKDSQPQGNEEQEANINQEDNQNEVDEQNQFTDFQLPDEQSPEETEALNLQEQEEEISEKINDAISSPKSKPKDIAQLIEVQEGIEVQRKSSQENIDKKTESEVNQYYKAHDQQVPEEQI